MDSLDSDIKLIKKDTKIPCSCNKNYQTIEKDDINLDNYVGDNVFLSYFNLEG